MERTVKVDIDEMTDRVVEKTLDKFLYKGKTIREWVELMVTAESVVEVRMIEELEKIKAEIGKCSDYVITSHNNTEADMNKLDGIILAITIIDTEITELKGENNDTTN